MKKLKIDKKALMDVIRASFISFILSIIGIVIFAVLYDKLEFNAKNVIIGLEIMKLISVFIGTFLGIKTLEKGVLKGIITSWLFLLYSLILNLSIDKKLDLDINYFINVILTIIFGVLSGVLAVNIKNKKYKLPRFRRR